MKIFVNSVIIRVIKHIITHIQKDKPTYPYQDEVCPFSFYNQLIIGGLNMVVIKNTTNIAMDEYNEIRFFKGVFWSIMIALFI